MQTINITLPQGWHELTLKQLKYLFYLIAEEYTATEIKTLCLFRWAGISIVSRKKGQFYLRMNKTEFFVAPLQIAEAITSLAWMDELPLIPVRLKRIGRYKAVSHCMRGQNKKY